MPGKTKKSSQSASPAVLPPRRRGIWIKIMLVFLVLGAAVLAYFDAWVRTGFEGRRWQLPAQVYARPLALYEGAPMAADNLQLELEMLGYQQTRSPSEAGSFDRQGSRFSIYSRTYDGVDRRYDSQLVHLSVEQSQIAQLTTRSGDDFVLLDPLRIGGIYPAQREERQLLQLDDMPKLLREGVLYVEDRHFYEHWGVAPAAIARAAWENLKAGRVVQGGSTVTQQLVKNFWLERERSLTRKLTEALMAVLVDWHYSKADILEAYLNEVYLGQAGQRAVHGIGMASQFYFGVSAEALESHQVALLIAMVKGPAYYNPRRYPERARERRDLVLSLMADAGLLSPEAATQATKRDLDLTRKPLFSANRYPAFMDLVKRQLRENYPNQVLKTAGLRIETSLDPQVQSAAEKAVVDTLNRLDRQGEMQAATLVTGAESGEVVAMVGGRDVTYPGFNRVLDAQRPIGSLIKPFVSLSALQQPSRYTLATTIPDKALVLEFENGDRWQPKNYDEQEHGEVALVSALAHSYNLSSVRLGLDVGLDKVIDTLQAAGLDARPPAYPSLLLGALNLSPMQVGQLYQSLATSGFQVPIRAIRNVYDHQGNLLNSYPYDVQQSLPGEAVFLTQYAMQTAAREGTAKALYPKLPTSLGVAAKTGTTNDGRDSWFAAFSGDYLGVVWVGYDDNRSARLAGSTGALPIWRQAMAQIPQRSLQPILPENVTYQWVDLSVGKRTAENCPNARQLPFIKGSEPAGYVGCSTAGRLRAWFDELW